jgi:hypothetical protein
LEQHSVTEWQSADDRNGREKITRARQAAEDLFKPTQQDNGSDVLRPASAGTPAEPEPRRQPRIFAVPPRAPITAPVERPAGPKQIQRKAVATKHQTRAVPPSQVGRVRALTNYGMTPAQVADLYDVSLGEIERIIRRPVGPGKSR